MTSITTAQTPFILSFINVSDDISDDTFLTVIFDVISSTEAGKEKDNDKQ